MTAPDFLDEPPVSATATDYDMKHLKLYIRLLDAHADGADWREAITVLFGIDPSDDPERARHIHESHLLRARWMTEHGYRDLLRRGHH
jgi:hypothetical protein